MKIRRTRGEIIFGYVNVILLGGLCVVTLYPLLYVIFASLSDPMLLLSNKGLLLYPKGFNLEAYELVLKDPLLGTSYLNTLFYVIVGTALSVVLTIMGAYAFSRAGTMWATPLMFLVVFTMWFSGGMIPYYLLVRDLGMYNTRWAMIIPKAISTYNLIIMRTAFQSVPVSLEESARLDGANDFTIMTRVIVPLSVPTIAVITLFYSVSYWNAWFNGMLFLSNRLLYPLQLFLREILILSSTDSMSAGSLSQGDQVAIGETVKYATIVVATVPILLVYPFVQKYFVKGVMIGAIKG